MAPKVFKERGPNPLSVMAIFHPFLKIKRKKSPVHNFTVLIPTHLQTSLTLKSEATGQESSARPTYPHRTGSEREPAHLPPPHGLREGACAHSDILSISSVQSSVESDSLQPKGLQHTRLLCPSPTSGACSNSCPWVSDAIQPSHPLSSPSPPALNLSQHQGLFQWVSSLHQVAKVLEFQLQHQSFQWIFRTDLL